MTITRRAVLAGGLGLAFLPLRARLAFAQAAAPVREITPLAGPVYRFRNNFHYSVFAVTPEGVIATDPINADAARWLKAEIAQSFSQPVRFVVYSHDHADHVSGGEVFADTARIVAHESARRTIIAERRPTAVPQVTFSDRMTIELGGHDGRAPVRRPEPLGQLRRDAVPEGAPPVRRRLHPGEGGRVP